MYKKEEGSFANRTESQSNVSETHQQIEIVLNAAFFENSLHGRIKLVGLIIIGNGSNRIGKES